MNPPSASNTNIRLSDLPGGEIINREVVLFGFDDRAFPYQRQLQTHLHPGTGRSLVLRPGATGAHDQFLRYYGTIIRINGEFHLWYIGSQGQTRVLYVGGAGPSADDKSLCYATSDDGIHWDKPNLGLVEYKGSKDNNLVDLPARWLAPAAVVLYEPEDPDPARRYKLVYEVWEKTAVTFNVAFSPDGLRWTPSKLNPVGPFLEMTGAMKWKGKYYVTGQDNAFVHGPVVSRKLATLVSKDFEHWSPCAALGLNRSPDLTGPSREPGYGWAYQDMEEVHVGAGLWNRGNVALGIYGQWHGHPTGDRRFVSIDLGLALTHDGLHYVEPIPGFRFIYAREQLESSPTDGFPALVQGQGMENVGDQTYFWYSLWRPGPGTGLRLATWERDRLGSLQPYHYPRQSYDAPGNLPQAISCAVQITQGRVRAFLNASGLGAHASLRVSLLDDTFRPIAGYSGADAAVVADASFRAPLTWKQGDVLGESLGEVHLQVEFLGVRPEDARLHAIHLEPVAENRGAPQALLQQDVEQVVFRSVAPFTATLLKPTRELKP
ncbi:MAG: hypothetical protein FJ272_07555 [Planctomycetes bacterium]|nr:hypothetical protein [Planctomycetota bacterium]